MTTNKLNRRKFLTLGLTSSIGVGALSGCTVSEIRRGITTSHQLYKGNVSQAISAQVPGLGIPEFDSLVRKQLAQFIDEIAANWSDKKTATPKAYVKYTDHYQSRAIIDFSNGLIQVETVSQKNPKAALKQAIVQTLLTPEDPSQVDLFSAQEPPTGATPFLLDLVRDRDNKQIRYKWRAERFADYLIQNRYKAQKNNAKTRHSVSFRMVVDYQNQQKRHYQLDVIKQSKRFRLEPALIYGIIETESSFNPYAVSSAPAYGLMQIVPTTAGRDVYRLLNKRDGIPSKNLLFIPARNIEYGSAYLSILFNKYLAGVRNSKSKEYCVIAAYNTGSGNVLQAFDGNRARALDKINRLSSHQVYQHLVRNLSSSEARNYLQKVTRNKQNYV
ncbi:murein transglycosylase domain-containing protein [Thiomicrorhabdus lithotrophica]|uniref:Murein transglycosylase domain-containing protein n=1 Tax=Thiomicrorhabdus lithotrophica TaxID=2949997 RepID=A0ABY8CC11_9GAMM|nr:murein transglycosylase domain-containing protein [Thiomicrorhabdus lithotrophica]WEJ62747.1 murein transglycosylase domain-containing protein [Thiomicrorhabdus lithotrophica]